MVRLGASASSPHMALCKELETVFQRHDIDFDWVLYSSYDGLVDAFVRKEIDIAWNGPLSYIQMKRALNDACQNVAMRDVDVNFTTQFITHPDSDITTVEDLPGKRFALAGRGSVQAGMLAYHFLKDSGINPEQDLAACSFYDDRSDRNPSDEKDVVERVRRREYDAGAVSRRVLETMEAQGVLPDQDIRVFWSSPGYSHCCFTAHQDLDPATAQRITDAFVSVDPSDPVGRAVLEAEDCSALVPGTTEGWEILEKVAEEQGLI